MLFLPFALLVDWVQHLLCDVDVMPPKIVGPQLSRRRLDRALAVLACWNVNEIVKFYIWILPHVSVCWSVCHNYIWHTEQYFVCGWGYFQRKFILTESFSNAKWKIRFDSAENEHSHTHRMTVQHFVWCASCRINNLHTDFSQRTCVCVWIQPHIQIAS